MAGDARRATVGDYVTLVRGTTYKGQLVGEPGPALLGLGSIEPGGGFRTGNYKTYGGDCPDELMLFPGDVYASLKGATKDGKMIGSVARVPSLVPTGRLTQDTVKLVFRTPDPEDATYVYWVLRTPQYRDYCAGHAMGSAVVALSRRDFLSYPVPPPTTERRRVVALLDAIEEKIELNRRMNETLEAMARALFKSWFVDFDPVRAKAEGRDPGLPKPLADLFPARLVDSEFGEIPEGWGVGTLDSVLVLQRGFDLPATERTSGAYPVLAASGPSGTHSDFKVRGPGVTTGRSGVLGKVFYVAEDFWPLNTSLWVKEFRHSRPAYAFHLLRGLDFALFNAGSAVPTLNRNHVHTLPSLLPPMGLIDAFERFASGCLARKRYNDEQATTLARLRDALLRRLISGQLRVPDAARLTARAI
ncbi:restriction endonuclease subunit S [Accumulibacter sp.]|uniref:restriction endonuclease subunit S n=1 Tax=Accumulibacter sp. TaxID=2053492 RepID=UPI001AD0A2C7|nr:restriction endonuclease subunit S [Accumulibacter sp.]MBN8452784.1 restriction endonuclease subunit S [Accumulibacter sp.]MBO3707714.1 restriction endonuclease subunit S [Candidatus Accumulibacter conexus]